MTIIIILGAIAVGGATLFFLFEELLNKMYEFIPFNLLLGKVEFDSKIRQDIYDFSKYNKNRIVGYICSTTMPKAQIEKEIIKKLKKQGYYKKSIVVPEYFYIIDGYLVYNKLTKRYKKHAGDIHLWDI